RQYDGADQRGQQQHGQHLKGQHPGGEDRITDPLRRTGRRRDDLIRAEGADEEGGQAQASTRADEDRRTDRAVEVGAAPDRRAGQHHREEQQDDDRTEIDEHLHPREELGAQQQELHGDRAERDDEPEPRPDEMLRRDDGQRGADRDQPHGAHERIRQRDRHAATRLAAAVSSLDGSPCGSCGGGGGTVSIHVPSRSLSCNRFRMSYSAYSNSGDQNSASNGHASMQIPQYMQSAKSMSNWSSTLRCRGRAAPGTMTSSLCESM